MCSHRSVETSVPPRTRLVAWALRHRRLLIVAAAWGSVLLTLHLLAQHHRLHPGAMAGELLHLCMGTAGPLIFVAIAALSPLLLVPAALLGAFAGLSFGPFWGVLLTLIGCNLSATLTYSLGRFSVGGRAEQPSQTGLLRRYRIALQQRAFLTVIALRLSFLPYDPINYMIGVARVPYLRFIAANTIGSLPGVLAIVLAGASLEGLGSELPSLNPWLIAAALGIAAICGLIAWLLSRRSAGPI